MNKRPIKLDIAFACLGVMFSSATHANSIVPSDLADLRLGAAIDGPLGTEVDNKFTFTDASNRVIAVAHLSSSVWCDARSELANDCSDTAVSRFSDVVYTYQHVVTPGADLVNDSDFPAPDEIVEFNDVTEFRLQFPAHGFLGVAGFDFDEATDAIGGVDIGIEQLSDGSLIWSVPQESRWNTPDPITFFWQSTQRPTGPTGVYATANPTMSGLARGPIPAAVPAVPEPATALLMLAGLVVVGSRCRARATLPA